MVDAENDDDEGDAGLLMMMMHILPLTTETATMSTRDVDSI